MQLTRLFRGRGGKSQGSVRTPYEAKNTLQSRAYARFVDLLSEGPIEGFCNSSGITISDAQLYSECQPSVTADYKLWYDPTRFDVEFDAGSSGPFTVYGKVSGDPLINDPLFSPSAGYPFSGLQNTNLRVSITASFRESTDTVNQTTDSTFKDNAEVYLLTYPRSEAEQVQTAKTITKNAHGFAVGAVVYRKRTGTNTYSWELLPDGVSPFAFQTRIIRSATENQFVGEIYPVTEEGRARALYFKTQGSNYLTVTPIDDPVTQVNHGFTVGTLIEYVTNTWVRASRYTQTCATVTERISDDQFRAKRQAYDSPQLNIPSVVATAVFFDDVPLADPATLTYNFANVRLDYRLGDEVQTPLLGFEQTETLLETTQSPTISHQTETPNVAPVIIELAPGNWDELLINLMLPEGLYRQDMTNGDIYGLGDNYGITGVASSSAAKPENQPPVIRISYRIVQIVNGAEQLSEEYPFGANDGLVVIRGKTMSPYEVTVRASLLAPNKPSADSHWYRLYFRRMSPDDSSYTNGDVARRSRVIVNTITGIVNARMSYPYCAVVGIEIDAEQFNALPIRGYQVKLMKVLVPSNYYPRFTKRIRTLRGVTYTDFRTYPEYNRSASGDPIYDDAGNPIDQIWDGTFYESWTDNPAWLVYALATDTRMGFGNYIQGANKWLFYRIARYCDELIPTEWNGTRFTSKEPRFACSAYFQTFEEAWKVLSDITSSFSGYVYYQSGTLIPVQDAPRTSRFAFSPANVENGFFTYTGIHKSGRYSSAVVKFTDPASRFRQVPIVEQDEELIGQLGWKPLEKTAFGCTSKYQARRFARRLLLSSKELTTTVKFTTGLIGSVLRPGDVIEVYDPSRSSLPFAGRILKISANFDSELPIVTLDRLITGEQLAEDDAALVATYGVIFQLPVGIPTQAEIASEDDLDKFMAKQITEPLRIFSISRGPEGTTVLQLRDPLPVGVEVGALWGLRRQDVQPQTFQIITVEETAKHKFGVVAVEYQDALYDAIDYDSVYEEPQINPDLDAWKRPHPPTNLRFEVWPRINEDGQKIYAVTISWSPPSEGFAKSYTVEWKRGLGDYQVLTNTNLTTAETIVVESDSYCVQVRTVGITGMLSVPVELCRAIGATSIVNQEIVSGLELLGQANNTLFTTGDASFDWRVNWSEATSEFQTGNPPTLAPNISDYEVIVYDVDMTALYATARKETSFVLTLDQNKGLPGGTRREFILGVRARTRDGLLSSQTTLRVHNERPPVPSFTFDADVNGYLLITFTPSNQSDFSHFNVWMSETEDFTPSNENLVYAGASSIVSIVITPAVITYFRVAEVDLVANSELDCNISDQYSIVGRRVGALTAFDFLTPGWNI